jgi:Na+-driven multidrug efflux pump
MAAGSYAHGAARFERQLRVFLWGLGISFAILMIGTPIMLGKPEWMVRMWISDDAEMEMARKLVKIPFYVNFLNAVNDCVTSFVITMRYAYSAMIPSLVRAVVFVSGTVGLYYTGKADPVRMMWSFCINDLVVFALDIVIFVIPIRCLILLIKNM